MWGVVLSKLTSIFLLTTSSFSLGSACPSKWFDCGNGKCIAYIWMCDGDNDCGNLKDEHDCEKPPVQSLCLSSQFECESDKHCIPQTWHCDGDRDCDDDSDEMNCDNIHEECRGFRCRNNLCIPSKWHCDGHQDCPDGSDEELCSPDKLCGDIEFLCSSGSCINRSLICDGKLDCTDGSDEGVHCGDSCDNAGCSQNCESTPSGPKCYCNDGYTLDTKDNKTCLDIDECLIDGFCSHKCINSVGSFQCFCRDGYELINRTCKAEGPDPLLILSTLQEIRGIRLRSNQYFSIRKAIFKASAVDVNPNDEQVYWAEISNRSFIYAANLDGSGFKTVLSHGLLVPEDIAVDYVANNIYITDSGLRQVLACTIAGTMCHVLHNKKVEKPRSVILDLTGGFMFWSDWGEHAAGIYRSGMDGSRRIILVSDHVKWPNAITIDHTTNRLYWADAKLNTIEYITLDGITRKVILNATVFHPYSLAVFEDTLYWADWLTFSLESCNKFTGHKMTLMARENGKHIMGVHVYHPVLTSKVMNPCWSNDCSHMCLISPTKGFSCACPHGFELSADEKSCTIKESASIFVSEGSSIFYIRPEAVGSETVTELPLSLTNAVITKVSYDPKARYLFVADINAPGIYAINMTSLHMKNLVRNHAPFPVDLSFDCTSNNLYWIDSNKGTAEVMSVDSLKKITLLNNLIQPVALEISPSRGHMFIATIGTQPSVMMCDMNGQNRRMLQSIQGLPMSLAVHPSKSILYWADPRAGTIAYLNYLNTSFVKTLLNGLEGVLSVAASEDYIYWTATKRELNLLKGNETYILQLPGQEKGAVSRKVTYAVEFTATEKSPCLIGNGGCSYLCLTSPNGRTCVCPNDLILAQDNVTCMERRCEVDAFRCMNNGRCLPVDLRCDGSRDCDDGSDEVGCGSRCSGVDFQCRNGRCILKSWRCDRRNDCSDNSDEEDCPEAACARDQVACTDGECISTLWRCDGESDCVDSSDEMNCNETRCDIESHVRCENGQCVPISWVCDGANDCYDGSDEKNCSIKAKMCLQHEFRCEGDESCVDELLKCDGREDCSDGSDEKNCSYTLTGCNKGMYRCEDGTCIYDYEVCDGHKDCSKNEEEINCTKTACLNGEILCPSSRQCIPRRWICDGYPECPDGSDERNCEEPWKLPPTRTSRTTAKECHEFFCYATGQCLPWSKVCDGRQDCADLPDEGGLCSRSCAGDNGGCSQICKKSPQGSKCSCFKGYELLSDNKTCDDIDECEEPGTCSHFCNNTKGGFKCSCAEGYFLHHDRRSCRADGGPATLVYLLGDQIRGYNLFSHAQWVYLNISSADMTGMDYDASEGIFYWTAGNDGSINTYSPDTHRQDIILRSKSKPVYVRYDWIEKNLYYADFDSNIGVCSKNGRFCRTLLQIHVTSIDISPTTGHMFWTVWAAQLNQISGVIERAAMDGSERKAIISDGTFSPMCITVDHVLKMIYWVDSKYNTLECADFQGLKRRQIVQHDMYYAFAMAVFEDNVYWSDWGTDSIIRCGKFTGECSKIREKNSKAHALLVVHRVMQPEGTSVCLKSHCPQLCLPKQTSYMCVCGDEFVERNGICEFKLTTSVPTVPVKCPEDYCLDAECVVRNGEYVCLCPPQYTGKYCHIIVRSNHKTYDYSWIVAVFFVVLVIGVMVLIAMLCCGNREKLHRVRKRMAIKFRNLKAGCDSRLVISMDDENAYDEVFLEQIEKSGMYRRNVYYMPIYNEDSYFKKTQAQRCEEQTVHASLMNIFRKLKRSSLFQTALK